MIVIVVVFTSNNSTENIDNDLFTLKQNGNIIVVIGIKPQVNRNFIQKLASSDKPKYQINVDFSTLDDIAYVLNRSKPIFLENDILLVIICFSF